MKKLEVGEFKVQVPLSVDGAFFEDFYRVLCKGRNWEIDRYMWECNVACSRIPEARPWFFSNDSFALYDPQYKAFSEHHYFLCEEINTLQREIAELDPSWVNKKGSFSKRLVKILDRAEMFDKKFKDWSGQFARKYAGSEKGFVVRVLRSDFWLRGDFGDGSSCFWSEKPHAIPSILGGDGFAVCLYDESGDKPLSRAWVLPVNSDNLRSSNDNALLGEYLGKNLNSYVVFNSYSVRGFDYNLTKWSRALSLLTETSDYRKISTFHINGGPSGAIWINNSAGWIFGDMPESLGKDPYLDLDIEIFHENVTCRECSAQVDLNRDEWERHHEHGYCCGECADKHGSGSRNLTRCCECGDDFDEDYTEDHGAFLDSVGYVCDRCLDRNYCWCEGCETYTANDYINSYRLDGESWSTWICDSCLEDYSFCEGCSTYYRSESNEGPDGCWYCDDCFDERFFYCDQCGNHWGRDQENENDYGTYCNDCLEELSEYCDRCGSLITFDDNDVASHDYDSNNESFCENCYKSLKGVVNG